VRITLTVTLLLALTPAGQAQTGLLPREPAPNDVGLVSAPSLKPAEPAPNRMPVGNPVPLPPPPAEVIPPPIRIGYIPAQVPGVAQAPFAQPLPGQWSGAAYITPVTPARPAGGVSSSYRGGVLGAATTTRAPATGRLGGIRSAVRGCASGSG
jgi:hypothetical protein